VLDPFSIGVAVKAMQMAFDGLTYCCEALGEGKVQVQKIKKATEDAKAIVSEAKNIWATIKGLFGVKPPPAPVVVEQPVDTPAVAKKKKKEEYTEYVPDENDLIQEYVKHLGAYFRNQSLLVDHIDQRRFEIENGDAEEVSNEEILELTMLEQNLNDSSMQLSEMMRVRAPKKLGALYSKFRDMNERLTEGKRKAKELKRIQRAKESWQQDQLRIHRLNRLMAVVGSLLVLAWTWGLLLSLSWLVKIHNAMPPL
jgi:hypothetical protein